MQININDDIENLDRIAFIKSILIKECIESQNINYKDKTILFNKVLEHFKTS